jgi:hypothetical protein
VHHCYLVGIHLGQQIEELSFDERDEQVEENDIVKSHASQAIAMHSTETCTPPGKGMTCGALRAGGFCGKNSA